MLEKDIEKQILEGLNKSGKGFFWKNATTGVYDKTKGAYRKTGKYQITGVSDIIGVNKEGIAVFIEVKKQKGKLADNQKNFLIKVKGLGAIAGVARSLKDALELIGG